MRVASLLVALLGFLPGVSHAEPVATHVSIAVAAGVSPEPFKAKLLARPLESTGEATRPRVWPVQTPGAIEIDLAPGSWRLSMAVAGFWAPDAVLTPEKRAVSFTLIPTGKIGGRLHLAPQEKAPGTLEVRFRSAPKTRPEVPIATVTCPVREDRWECEVPAANLDLRAQGEGFVPRYLWGVVVPPGRQADLGVLELVRGASLIGRVEVEGASTQAGQLPSIELSPSLIGGNSAWAGSERILQRSFTARVNERGFFQVVGIPAGEYVVTGRLEGFAPARSQPLVVLEATEFELREPILLQRPCVLEVHTSPGADPSGQAWRVELLEGGTSWPPRRMTPSGTGATDPAGLWRQEGLVPGHYMLLVRDSAGSEWRREWIEVVTGMPPLDLEIDVVEIEGTIEAGDEPIETTFWLEREIDAGQRIRFRSDEKGRFSGFLPEEGTWGVDLQIPREGLQALQPVEVKRLQGSRIARVAIRIPNTYLAIQIVDEAGKPSPNAQVTILSSPEKRRREAQATSDERGEVVLRGLPPGTVQIHARKDTAASDWAMTDLTEGSEGDPVQLVLREKLRLTGKIVAPQGPIAGALVTAFPHVSGAGNAWVGRAISEADGAFELRLDRSFPGGSLTVFAPGFAIRLMPMPPLWQKEKEPLTIPVSQESGEILIDLRGLGEDPLNRSRLTHGGGQLPLAPFLREGLAQLSSKTQILLLPRMEPGEYSLCPESRIASDSCTRGFLASNGRLELRLESHGEPQARGGPP